MERIEIAQSSGTTAVGYILFECQWSKPRKAFAVLESHTDGLPHACGMVKFTKKQWVVCEGAFIALPNNVTIEQLITWHKLVF